MENNYLHVGEEWHCLYCHITFKRSEEPIIEHSKKHINSKIQGCDGLQHLLDCPEWARQIKV